jgi:hypothetical protein
VTQAPRPLVRTAISAARVSKTIRRISNFRRGGTNMRPLRKRKPEWRAKA